MPQINRPKQVRIQLFSCNWTIFICKQVVGLGIQLKLISVPPEAKTVPIDQKRKRGRPAKTKPALIVQ